MNINCITIKNWKSFKLCEIFSSIEKGKVSDTSILDDGNEIYYIGAKKADNGIMKKCKYNEDLISKGNCIIFICDGQGSIGYNNYMPDDFIGTVNLSLGYSENLNQYTGLFLVTVLDKERFRFSFGRKRKTTLREAVIKLPATSEGNIDWQFMEDYIKSLNINLPKTRNKLIDIAQNFSSWKYFSLSDLFKISYGNKLDLNKQVITTKQEGGINFVSRDSNNNGVVAVVEPIDGVLPFPKGSITVPLGGSYLGTSFIQSVPFYTAQNIAVLEPKKYNKFIMNDYHKLFILPLIRFEAKTKFCAFGRELNKYIKDLNIKLPSTSTGEPDWQFMENYIKSLPYGDCL